MAKAKKAKVERIDRKEAEKEAKMALRDSSPLAKSEKKDSVVAAINLKDPKLAALFDRLESAKKESFLKKGGFWRPEAKGETLQGVYVGADRISKRYLTHFMAVRDADGRTSVMKFNGRTVLTQLLAEVAPGTPCRITYSGRLKAEEDLVDEATGETKPKYYHAYDVEELKG